MARKRMIDPNFWASEDVAQLSHTERLLLIGLFSTADDYGKGRAAASYLRSVIFPYDDLSLNDIRKSIVNIQSHISIIFYEINKNKYYKFTNWSKWQKVSHPQQSIIPDPPEPSIDIPGNDSGTNPEQIQNETGEETEPFRPNVVEFNLVKDNVVEDNLTARTREEEIQSPSPSSPPPKKTESENKKSANDEVPEKHYEKCMGMISPAVANRINSYIEDGLEPGLINEAIDQACLQNARRWSYVESILNSCVSEGIKTIKAYMARELEYKSSKADAKITRYARDKPANVARTPQMDGYRPEP